MPTAEAPQYTREKKSLPCTAAAAVDKPQYMRDSFSPSCTAGIAAKYIAAAVDEGAAVDDSLRHRSLHGR